MKFPVKKLSLQPVLPLVPENQDKVELDKSKFISMDLKSRAGGKNVSTYKKYVKRFEEGTPQEWIDLLRDLEEIWRQNTIAEPQDRASIVRTVLRGDALTGFDTALDDVRTNDEGDLDPMSIKNVSDALDRVTDMVFPHRALEMQKLWMQRGMKKPYEMSTRKMASAITRINNALPMFPGATEDSKFTEEELVGLIEWSLPEHWRSKFDLDGFIPTLHPKIQLIAHCEAIERNEQQTRGERTNNPKNTKFKTTSGKNKEKPKGKFYCTEHGENPTHATKDCYTLKNREKKNDGSNGANPKKFTNKNFRKELNVLSKNTPKEKLLDLYAQAISKEKAKLAKAIKRKVDQMSEDSESDDNSVHVIEKPIPKKKKKPTNEPTREEKDFLKKIQQMDDAEESDGTNDSKE